MFIEVLISGALAGLATVVGAYLFRFFDEKIKTRTVYVISFAAGLLLANAFLHLLPESFGLNSYWPFFVLGAIAVFYFLEQTIIIHSCQEEHCEVHAMGTMSLLGLGFHSLVDGLAIGVSFEVNFAVGLIATSAIIFHKFAEGGCTYSLLVCDKALGKKALFYSWLVALATPIGAILAFIFLRQAPDNFLGALLAMAAGTFIYIASSDLLPATHKKSNWLNILLFFAGMVFVALLGQFGK
ncbi:MAG TPA: ZIP family metal transporter [Candidatus Portnoybacteria bacterium]|nr:ZIP family metal transporter [Candidatus Portnoybacteria bacterium]